MSDASNLVEYQPQDHESTPPSWGVLRSAFALRLRLRRTRTQKPKLQQKQKLQQDLCGGGVFANGITVTTTTLESYRPNIHPGQPPRNRAQGLRQGGHAHLHQSHDGYGLSSVVFVAPVLVLPLTEQPPNSTFSAPTCSHDGSCPQCRLNSPQQPGEEARVRPDQHLHEPERTGSSKGGSIAGSSPWTGSAGERESLEPVERRGDSRTGQSGKETGDSGASGGSGSGKPNHRRYSMLVGLVGPR